MSGNDWAYHGHIDAAEKPLLIIKRDEGGYELHFNKYVEYRTIYGKFICRSRVKPNSELEWQK